MDSHPSVADPPTKTSPALAVLSLLRMQSVKNTVKGKAGDAPATLLLLTFPLYRPTMQAQTMRTTHLNESQ